MKLKIVALSLLALLSFAFDASAAVKKLTVKSTSFRDGKTIPDKYGCNGADVSPQLSWSKVPAGTKSIAIVMVDFQGGPWYHWGVYNIAPTRTSVGVNFSPPANTETLNDFGGRGYGGPCPPGETHNYYYYVYALNTTIVPENFVDAASFYSGLTTGPLKRNVLAKGGIRGKYFSY